MILGPAFSVSKVKDRALVDTSASLEGQGDRSIRIGTATSPPHTRAAEEIHPLSLPLKRPNRSQPRGMGSPKMRASIMWPTWEE